MKSKEKNISPINSWATFPFFNYILKIIINFIRGVPPSEKEVKVSNKLYVSNIPFSVTNEDLNDLFQTCGTVLEANIVLFKDTGKSRGFGFVTMETEKQALEAINLIDGREIKGRKLHVCEAKESPPNKIKRAQKLSHGTCILCGEENDLFGFENDKGICSSCIIALSRASRPVYHKPNYNKSY